MHGPVKNPGMKAKYLKDKMKSGKKLTKDQARWLKEYRLALKQKQDENLASAEEMAEIPPPEESKEPDFGNPEPSPQLETQLDAKITSELPGTQESWTPPPPPPSSESESDPTSAEDQGAEPQKEAASAPATTATHPSSSPSPEKVATAELLANILITAYRTASLQLQKEGMPGIPESVSVADSNFEVWPVVHRSAVCAFMTYLPDNVNSTRAHVLIAASPGAVLGYQAWTLQKKKKASNPSNVVDMKEKHEPKSEVSEIKRQPAPEQRNGASAPDNQPNDFVIGESNIDPKLKGADNWA